MKDLLSLVPFTLPFRPGSEPAASSAALGSLQPRYQRAFRGLALLILMLYSAGALTGCALFRRPVEQACDPQFVLETLAQRNDRIQSFIGQGEVVLNSFGTEHRAKIFIALLKPGYVLLKLFAPGGYPVMVFLVRNGVLTSYNFEEKLVTEKPLNDGLIRLQAGVEISLAQFVAACTGNVQPIAYDRISCRRRIEQDLTILVLRVGILKERVQKILLGTRELRTESVQVRRDGKVELAVSFTYPQEVDKILIPKSVFIDLPRVPASVRIKYDRTSINAKLLPEHFRFDVPEGWRFEESST